MNSKFLKDPHWYIALLLGGTFWLLYGFFIQPLKINSVFEPLTVLIFSVLLYPIVEEIVFRGLLQDFIGQRMGVARNYWGLSLANILTSVVFALSHLINQVPIWALLTFFPSLVYGYFKDRHQSILPGMLLHSFYNLGFITLIAHYE